MEEQNINVITSPLKAIRAHCLECAGSANEVKLCPIKDCELYPFRFGKNPFRQKREMTEEQRIAAAERFAKARESKQEENYNHLTNKQARY